jgi:hypothetical protein
VAEHRVKISVSIACPCFVNGCIGGSSLDRDTTEAKRPEQVGVHITMRRNSIVFTTQLAALICCSAPLSFAESWSGTLVDSKCYDAEERNVNPTDTSTHVDRDGNREIRYCLPRAKTKSFAVVQADGPALKLDSAGNAKAAELVPQTGKKSRLFVTITGGLGDKTIKVDSISIAR